MILFSMSSTILSELVFAAIEETEDYWAFIKATQDDREIEPDSLVGIILSTSKWGPRRGPTPGQSVW